MKIHEEHFLHIVHLLLLPCDLNHDILPINCSLLTDKVRSKFVTNCCGTTRSNIDYIICIFNSDYSQSVLKIVPVPYMDKIVEHATRFDYYFCKIARHVNRPVKYSPFIAENTKCIFYIASSARETVIEILFSCDSSSFLHRGVEHDQKSRKPRLPQRRKA